MSALIDNLPPLPQPADEQASWSYNIQSAYRALAENYDSSRRIALQEDSDPLRVKYHIERISQEVLPLLQGLEADRGLPDAWLLEVARAFGTLAQALCSMQGALNDRETSNVQIPQPVRAHPTGRKGRPRKVISADFLAHAFLPSRKISIKKLSSVLGVHRHTVRNYMKLYGIKRQWDEISDSELDMIIRRFKEQKPKVGFRYITGFFRSHGVRIQKHRILASIRRVDGLGRTLRTHATIRRRKYTSTRPNAIWHCDGHHKLILWGIVIHGFVDGFCRTVVGLRASTNNAAATVLDVFLEAVREYGTPSRVRGDRGGENIEVSVWMILRRGRNRASFMWGSSTHNTRIERMWVEIGRHFCRAWRAFFLRLERCHGLDRQNPAHLWLLHTLFLDAINADCRAFQEQWNAHPISGPDAHDMSPQDMRFLGQTQSGMYTDDCCGLTEEEIHQFYGTTHDAPRCRRTHQTGAGHPPEEDESDDEDMAGLEEEIAYSQTANIRHPGVPVPEHASPFSEADYETVFFAALNNIRSQGYIPWGYAARAEEQEGGFEEIEIIRYGRRRRKELEVALPGSIWYPRTVLWVQGLHVLSQIMYGLDESV